MAIASIDLESIVPDRTVCPHCGKVGFVRREHVVKGGTATTLFYCGACNRAWEAAGGHAKPSDDK